MIDVLQKYNFVKWLERGITQSSRALNPYYQTKQKIIRTPRSIVNQANNPIISNYEEPIDSFSPIVLQSSSSSIPSALVEKDSPLSPSPSSHASVGVVKKYGESVHQNRMCLGNQDEQTQLQMDAKDHLAATSSSGDLTSDSAPTCDKTIFSSSTANVLPSSSFTFTAPTPPPPPIPPSSTLPAIFPFVFKSSIFTFPFTFIYQNQTQNQTKVSTTTPSLPPSSSSSSSSSMETCFSKDAGVAASQVHDADEGGDGDNELKSAVNNPSHSRDTMKKHALLDDISQVREFSVADPNRYASRLLSFLSVVIR